MMQLFSRCLILGIGEDMMYTPRWCRRKKCEHMEGYVIQTVDGPRKSHRCKLSGKIITDVVCPLYTVRK